MKPHPRIRKTMRVIKWGGAAVTVLLVVVWIGSVWWPSCIYGTNKLSIYVYPGGVFVDQFLTEKGHPEPDARRAVYEMMCKSRPEHLGAVGWEEIPSLRQVWFPLWPIAAASLLITALAFRLDTLARRRERMNLCPKCHYDRTGLAGDAVCPECGTGSGGETA